MNGDRWNSVTDTNHSLNRRRETGKYVTTEKTVTYPFLKGSLQLQLYLELFMYLLEITQLHLGLNETNFDKQMLITLEKGW